MFGILVFPLLVVVVLAMLVLHDQNNSYRTAQEANELARIATAINELDQCLGEEALAGNLVLQDPSEWAAFAAVAEETDDRLEKLSRLTDGEGPLQEAIDATAEVLAMRGQIQDGLVSPLQLAHRYSIPRRALISSLVERESEFGLRHLTALIEARSAHLDERFASELALVYQTWAPGQHSAATGALALQRERIRTSTADPEVDFMFSDPTLSKFRDEMLLSSEIPDLDPKEYAAASDRWLASLNEAIDAETTRIEGVLSMRAESASRARILTVAGTLIAVIVAFLVAGMISFRVVSRVHRLSDFTRQFANGERGIGKASDEVHGRDELAELAAAFDEMTDEVSQRDRRLARHAQIDDLTGLLNRRAILERWDDLVDEGQGDGFVMAIDLDGFKPINDRYGHQTGDQVLTFVAERLRRAVETDGALVGRIGGDEFLAIFNSTDQSFRSADESADSLLNALSQPVQVGDLGLVIGGSIGIARTRPGATATELLAEADGALYTAKNQGGSVAREADADLRSSMADAKALRAEARDALEQRQFTPALQPIWSASGRLHAFEALARWERPDGSLAGPGEFLEALSHERLLPGLDTLILDKAAEVLSHWSTVHDSVPAVSVNVSTPFLESPHFVETVRSVLSDYRIDPGRLILEITEFGLMTDATANAQRLQTLRDIGVRIAVDDYGTGYSSLAYLQRLPIDYLKLDRQFVTDIHISETNQAIVRSVLTLAVELGIQTVAEGVETHEEHVWLINAGTDFVQGYLCGRPTSTELAEALVTEHRSTLSPNGVTL